MYTLIIPTIFVLHFSDSSSLDDPPFNLYKKSTTVSNNCLDQINYNVNHNYNAQIVQPNYESQVFPISCK